MWALLSRDVTAWVQSFAWRLDPCGVGKSPGGWSSPQRGKKGQWVFPTPLWPILPSLSCRRRVEMPCAGVCHHTMVITSSSGC